MIKNYPIIKHRHLILCHWKGEARLWKAYWLIAVLGGWAFWTIILNLVEFAMLPELLAMLLLAVYSIYAGVGVWRCSFNVDWKVWAYISRAVIFFSAATFVFELTKII
ncbi:MAG: hypothetical protein ACKVIK_06995 [Rhodospirillales bacterium]|jgi:hypothetical protein